MLGRKAQWQAKLRHLLVQPIDSERMAVLQGLD
jgi:hypothetical protein